jgi:hypothetical protein
MILNLLGKIAFCIRTERKFGFLTYRAKWPFALERHTSADGYFGRLTPKIPCDEVSYAE